MMQGLCFSVSRCWRADGGFTRTRAVLRCHMFKYKCKQEVEHLFIFDHRKCKLETNLTEPERKTHVAVFPLFLFEWEREWERL